MLASVLYSEGRSHAVIEAASGRIIPIPESYEYLMPVVRPTWMSDGRVFLLRQSEALGLSRTYIVAEILSLDVQSGTLTLDATYPIGTSQGSEGYFYAAQPVQLANGQLAFGLPRDELKSHMVPGLYLYTDGDGSLRKVSGLPPTNSLEAHTHWAPDASGVFVQLGQFGQVLYAPGDGSALYDLTGALGEYVCCFTWLD